MEIDCQAVKAKVDAGEDFVFLDCREQDEFDHVRIEGTTLLPMSELQQRVGELVPHKTTNVIIHCHHGGRSLNVVMWLRQQGFTDAWSMAGGIDQWAAQIDTSLVRY